MDGTDISKFLKKRNAKKIPGKKAPIILGENYFKVEEIFKYAQMGKNKSSWTGENNYVSVVSATHAALRTGQ